jgi:hypothetical protein
VLVAKDVVVASGSKSGQMKLADMGERRVVRRARRVGFMVKYNRCARQYNRDKLSLKQARTSGYKGKLKRRRRRTFRRPRCGLL